MPKTRLVTTTETTATRLRTELQQVAAGQALRIGCDIVQISGIRQSVETFGERFTERFFTAREMAYAQAAPALLHERLAARFAAKEAAIKAFALGEAGVCWREIETCKQADGRCTLALHGRAARHAQFESFAEVALSLSHDGDYATAMVVALPKTTRAIHP